MKTRAPRLALPWLFSGLAGLLLLAGCAGQAAAFDLYFVRHAETMSNATGAHSAANDQTFSEAGTRQIEVLTARLESLRFDAILVSPLWRAQRTILPYLQKHGKEAEIWPELAECCWQKDQDAPPSGNRLKGAAITTEDRLFRFRDQNAAYRLDNGENFADGMARVKETASLLKGRFGGSAATVLVVGHYWHGAKLLQLFLGNSNDLAISPANGQIIHLRQLPDGSFELVVD